MYKYLLAVLLVPIVTGWQFHFKPKPTGLHLENAPYAKYHLVESNVFASADTWYTVPFDSAPASENSFGIRTNATGDTVLFDVEGHAQINGCLRPTWLGNNNQTATMYSRIIWSTNNWATTNEARCLQAENTRNRQGGEGDTLLYHGSLTVSPNTQIRLQARVTNTNLIIRGHTVFDNPVAATINILIAGAAPD
jgi:hypothetical protein